ncbi:hypothetical protein ACEPAF_42 [Sanghuangporus sanghuang]
MLAQSSAALRVHPFLIVALRMPQFRTRSFAACVLAARCHWQSTRRLVTHLAGHPGSAQDVLHAALDRTVRHQ